MEGRQAKLTGKWFGDVQCGWCGNRIAGRDSYNGDGRYYLYFDEGISYQEREDYWGMTKRGKKRMARGQNPGVRHQRKLSWGVAGGGNTRHNIVFSVDQTNHIVPLKLPARAECPDPNCGGFSVLDPQTLNVDNSGPF